MVFERDAARFAEEFPEFALEPPEWLPWFTYLAAGGLTMRELVPGFLAGTFILLERLMRPLRPLCSLHWLITLRKRG
jgi:hypothetical protein